MNVPGPEQLLALRDDPPRLGRLAARARREAFGPEVLVRASEDRRPEGWPPRWPAPSRWHAGDRIVCEVAPGQAKAWVDYLQALAHAGSLPADCSIAPHCREAAGTHKLWLIASARLALPAHVRVEARHDLLGIRVAQVALGFGADTLSGPIEPDRKLPLAGTTRPNENTRAGLFALVEQAGLTAVGMDAEATA
jgi:hypothetical protein